MFGKVNDSLLHALTVAVILCTLLSLSSSLEEQWFDDPHCSVAGERNKVLFLRLKKVKIASIRHRIDKKKPVTMGLERKVKTM